MPPEPALPGCPGDGLVQFSTAVRYQHVLVWYSRSGISTWPLVVTNSFCYRVMDIDMAHNDNPGWEATMVSGGITTLESPVLPLIIHILLFLFLFRFYTTYLLLLVVTRVFEGHLRSRLRSVMPYSCIMVLDRGHLLHGLPGLWHLTGSHLWLVPCPSPMVLVLQLSWAHSIAPRSKCPM